MRALPVRRLRIIFMEGDSNMNSKHTNATPRILRFAGVLATGLALGLVARGLPAEQAKDSTAARLQAIEDRLAIEELLYGDYSRALDSGNWKAFAALFTEDGEVRVESVTFKTRVHKGHAEIEKTFAGPPPEGAPGPPSGGQAPGGQMPQMVAGKHVMTNFSLQLQGDQATGTAYWIQMATTKDGQTIVGASGRYTDTFKRVNGRWKFYRKVISDKGLMDMGALAAPPARP